MFGHRDDDGSVFTAGQTNQVDVTVAADRAVRVRDEIPAEWSAVGGDDVTTATDNGRTTVTFDETTDGGELTYFVEAPSGATSTGDYQFGPVQWSSDGDVWTALPGTTETNSVVAVSTSSVGVLGVLGTGGLVTKYRDRVANTALLDRFLD